MLVLKNMDMKKLLLFFTVLSPLFMNAQEDYVKYVNPYMGNISHTLVPSLPTVQLPHSMLRVYPKRQDFATWIVEDFSLVSPSHRNIFSGNGILPFVGDSAPESSTLDNEKISPYSYSAILDGQEIGVDFAPSFKSAVYSFDFSNSAKGESRKIRVRVDCGEIKFENGRINLIQNIGKFGNVKMYITLEFDAEPREVKVSPFSRPPEKNPILKPSKPFVAKRGADAVLDFGKEAQKISARYGISFIDFESAQNNLQREIRDFDIKKLKEDGRKIWNETLSKIKIKSEDEEMKRVFYTSFWRTFERMIDFSEYGKYYSAYDNKVHKTAKPFYCDDWIWDTYRTSHPLRVLMEPSKEAQMLQSYIDMASQTPEKWLPTFPQIFGDAHAMNGNHVVASFWDAYQKGVRGFDFKAAVELSVNTLLTESIVPWHRGHRTVLDDFYSDNGYFPALKTGEAESVPQVNSFEKRQSVAVTLAASFDDWCVYKMLGRLEKDFPSQTPVNLSENKNLFFKRSKNAENLFNAKTGFFHPKDSEGNFIEPFDYRISGGLGFRDYYDENNAWTYRWDAPHLDLVGLMGGAENFEKNLDDTFHTPVGLPKWRFWGSHAPDQTGGVGQFSMGNEPSFHIPYLYNRAGKGWKTQKAVRALVYTWFRSDLMGVPGDEDGGAMSAFVVWSMLGLYPDVGEPTYQIGSPFFEEAEVSLENGGKIKITAKNNSRENKYVKSLKINGEIWEKLSIPHDRLKSGAVLEFIMSSRPNKNSPQK